MAMQSRLLIRANQLSEAGNQDDARRLLQAILREDPGNETAWFSYIRTLAHIDERIQALRQFLRIDPANRRAQEVLWMLWEKKLGAERSEQRTTARPRRLPYIALSLAIFVALLAGSVYAFQQVVNRWADRYNALLEQHTSLTQNHDSLIAEHSSLIEQFTTLQYAYEELTIQHSQLTQEHSDLLAAHNTLLGEHQALQDDYSQLTAEFDWLNTNALSPPYISVNGRKVQITFLRTDGAVANWEVPFENLELSLQIGNKKREGAFWERASTVNLNNTSTGDVYTVWDYREFVDPDPFELVMDELYSEAATDYDFIYETWNIVAQLMTYSADIAETPRLPMETLLAGGGDCEDTSILFASMIKAAPVDWKVELVYMDADSPTDPKDVNHVIVAINTGTVSYLIETTSDYDMQPFDYVRGWYFEVN